MTVVINGTTGITNDGGYTGDGVVFADTTPANTLVTTTGGNVGIGTSSPSSKLDVVGTGSYDGVLRVRSTGTNTPQAVLGVDAIASAAGYVGTLNNLPFQIRTNDTERARVDTSGNLLVGVTGSPYAGNIQSISTGAANQFYAVNTNTADTTVTLYGGRCSGVDRFRVYGNGNVVNTNNSYGAFSDVKLKENIEDASSKLDKLNQVRVVTYNLKTDPTQKLLGVIAQELEQVFPSLIEEVLDRDDDGSLNGETTKTVKMSVFVPMLIKAIQEQQALITTLTERITALEA
jgi:hypothetical protein